MKIFFAVVILYAIVVALFYFFQGSIVFQSTKLPKDHEFVFNQKFREYFIPTADGETINALLFQSQQDSSKGLILYFHGNAGNLQRWGEYAVDFTKLGYDILMVDYHGYGKSSGEPSEENLYADAKSVWEWSVKNIAYKKLIIYGRSLGSAVASNIAIDAQPDLLFLETPFEELNDVIYFFKSQFKFSNKQFLPQIKCKKVIIQGTNDGIVPLSSAMKLRPLLGKDDRFVVIVGGEHNNLRDFPEYHKALAEVLN
jgi:pimeloyl-ACP methyl ester carboxylesterase